MKKTSGSGFLGCSYFNDTVKDAFHVVNLALVGLKGEIQIDSADC